MGIKRPPRVAGLDYVGLHAYFLTICTFQRVRWFEDDECAKQVVLEFLRTADAYGFATVAYCIMPDHVHALVEATRPDSHLVRFVAMFKQRTAFAYAQAGRLWQEGFFDRVLREGDDPLPVAAYIVANPVRARLCQSPRAYPYLGSSRYTLEQLCEAIQIEPTSRP